MSARATRRFAVVTAVLVFAVAAITVWTSLGWIGRTFPGFLVLQNRVIPSVALPAWAPGAPDRLFQLEILSVDGQPMASAEAVYAAVAERPVGTPVRYELRAADGQVSVAEVPTRLFGRGDYLMLFGIFLVLSIAFAVAGCWVAYVQPDSAAAHGLLATGIFASLFGLTALDLYGPYWFVRLHLIGEAMFGGAVLHLAVVFPVEWFGARRRQVIFGIYASFGLIAMLSEFVFPVPAAYTTVHLLVTVLHGVASLGLVTASMVGYLRDPSPLVRRRIGVVAMSVVVGFLMPGLMSLVSGLIGGKTPINLSFIPAGIFPLGLGYAIVQRDLFEIDVFIRRAATYAIVVATVASVYLLMLVTVGGMLHGDVLGSPVALALPNLLLLFAMAPLQQRVQVVVDGIFFRAGYDAKVAQADLGHALASAHSLAEVTVVTQRVLEGALAPQSWGLFLCEPGGALQRVGGGCGPLHVALSADLYERCARGDLLSRFEQDAAGEAFWTAVPADLVVPVGSSGLPLAIIALGAKESGRQYTMHDGAFLRAIASQVTLALTNARAFAQLEELNANLELQVHERTAELELANEELNASVEQVRGAYRQLEQSQASLVRADRMATLGRLAAGIAHEMNTPLAAVQNSLKMLEDLSAEYAASIDDPSVTPKDHHDIAHEMVTTSSNATGWARKAAAFLAKVKMHARDSSTSGAREVIVSEVISEVEALLTHRLREVSCQPELSVTPDLRLVGDPGRLGQVLVNLVGNALDAYEDCGLTVCRLAIAAHQRDQAIVIEVRDWAGGIPSQVLPRIFDELYTTKEPGRGTGLGLWIARNLIEEQFGGTLTVDTTEGVGSCFRLTLPRAQEHALRPEQSAA